jgi:hypothetical protein
VVVLISGALVIQLEPVAGLLVPPAVLVGVGAWVSGAGVWLGTLLGPEGTGRFAWSPLWWWLCAPVGVACFARWGRSSAIPVWVLLGGRRLWVAVAGRGSGCLVAGGAGRWLLFVNCIVDASIFVAKFFRAHGGCLGIRSR